MYLLSQLNCPFRPHFMSLSHRPVVTLFGYFWFTDLPLNPWSVIFSPTSWSLSLTSSHVLLAIILNLIWLNLKSSLLFLNLPHPPSFLLPLRTLPTFPITQACNPEVVLDSYLFLFPDNLAVYLLHNRKWDLLYLVGESWGRCSINQTSSNCSTFVTYWKGWAVQDSYMHFESSNMRVSGGSEFSLRTCPWTHC